MYTLRETSDAHKPTKTYFFPKELSDTELESQSAL